VAEIKINSFRAGQNKWEIYKQLLPQVRALGRQGDKRCQEEGEAKTTEPNAMKTWGGGLFTEEKMSLKQVQ